MYTQCMKYCNGCETEKPEDEFYFRNKEKGTRQGRCKVCFADRDQALYRAGKRKGSSVESQEARRLRNLGYIYSVLSGTSCMDCGNSDIEVLEFDHLGDKTDTISKMQTASLERLKVEVAKCEVVCANCHKKRTYKRKPCWRNDGTFSG